VSESLPKVTVLIPARPDMPEVDAVAAARRLDYPPDKLEILLARGRQPSVQRNTGMREAGGEILYFLDDDSMPPPGNLRRAVRHFSDPDVEVVGGPNVCPPDAPPLEQVFALVLSSWIAFGPSRARYVPVGAVRATGEKELILCNMLARRKTMLDLGGFNEALYPNEENALMDEIQKRGKKLLYDPGLIVHRRPRRNFGAFIRMVRTYGRGRAEQFRVTPTPGSALNFIPPLFCVYLAFLPLLIWLAGMWMAIPLLAYVLTLVVQWILLIPAGGVMRALCAVPVIVMANILYGIGFWCGLFTPLQQNPGRPGTEVACERVKMF
jgi:cellulose synthase/poly-beta-1,6-N-acetylglucosamine synthase-like glycosyltransferase